MPLQVSFQWTWRREETKFMGSGRSGLEGICSGVHVSAACHNDLAVGVFLFFSLHR